MKLSFCCTALLLSAQTLDIATCGSNANNNPSQSNTGESEGEKPNETETPADPANGHEFADLGLSVMWATMNVGAETPEAYGNYYAWGETAPQAEELYDSDSYKFKFDTKENFTKYNATDGKTVLDPRTMPLP